MTSTETVPADSRRPVEAFLASDLDLFIGGRFVPARSGRRFETVNPADGQVIAEVAEAGEEDIDAAVDAAREGLARWNALTPARRARILWDIADLIEDRADEFIYLDVLDNGKPASELEAVDVPLVVDIYRYYAGWVTKIEGRQLPISAGAFHTYTRREPMGVVGAITPWNFPLLMCAYKLGPALAAGNAVVLKPAEQTPLSALYLAHVLQEAGVPDGVVNIVPGFGETAGAHLVSHPGVDKVSFTGEYTTGQKIVQNSIGNLKRVTLELGGKAPNIVFADADLDAAVEGAFGAVFFNQGQCCVAGSRLLVEKPVYDELLERLVERARGIRLGSGLSESTDMGPVVSGEQLERVMGYVESGKREGAKLLVGGDRASGDGLDRGFFMQPTVFADTDQSMTISNDEIFGPVVGAQPFTTEDEAVEVGNSVRFGLTAGVWTSDVKRAHRMAARLQAGTVWVNAFGSFDVAAPYGGFKMSGYGRELGEEALEAYLQTKTVWVAL